MEPRTTSAYRCDFCVLGLRHTLAAMDERLPAALRGPSRAPQHGPFLPASTDMTDQVGTFDGGEYRDVDLCVHVQAARYYR